MALVDDSLSSVKHNIVKNNQYFSANMLVNMKSLLIDQHFDIIRKVHYVHLHADTCTMAIDVACPGLTMTPSSSGKGI